MDINNFKSLNFSVFGKETVINGELILEGDTIISGRINGNIISKGNNKLIIEQTAVIEGDISCHDLEVFGKFLGTINASGKCSIRSSAEISGKVFAAQMSIYPGAILNMEGNANSSHPLQS